MEPAAHACVFPPLHLMVHAEVPPQTTEHSELPLQSAVHPPFGHSIVQELFPVHDTTEPVSTVAWHVLPPPQLTVLFVPVDSVHWLVPSHVVVQFD